ncbi:MAG TPA: TonB-dependent receptor [Gammaproteobacteria bacterium]|nr:TonB-dependent receptor [Gammaproteobacteria bacterium]
MKLSKVHVAVVAAMTGAGGLVVQPAFAQQAGGGAQGGLEEIVVTATRRAENLQEVPISIVAITGDSLEMRGLDSLEQVSQGIPNVVITGGGGGTSNSSFRMRGIPNVGTYVDGVWQVATNGILTQEFVDIDRVEVLRGPQGTMFGRDSTGGAIRIWTKRPADEFGGNVTATTGSNDRRDVKGSIDLPLTDKLKTKWTGANLHRGGYIESLTTGEKGGGVDQQVYRGDIVWSPTEKLNFRFDYQSNGSTFVEPRVQDAMFRTYDDPAPTWVKSVIGLPEMYTYVGTDYRGNAVEPFFNPVNQVAGYPGGKVGKWQNRSGTTLPEEFTTDQGSFEMNWQLSDNIKLQYLGASTTQDQKQVVDWDNSQYDLVLDQNLARTRVASNEIQITGGHGKVEWLGGYYNWTQSIHARGLRWQVNEFQKGLMNPNNVFASSVCNPLQANGTPVPLVATGGGNYKFAPGSYGIPQIGLYAGQLVNLGGAGPTAPVPGAGAWQTCQQVYFGAVGGAYDTLSRSGQDGWAVFGETTIHLTDKLDLTLGLRHHDQSGFTVNQSRAGVTTGAKPVDPTIFPTGDPYLGSDNNATYTPFQFDKNTTRMVLQRKFNDKINGYLSYSEGFNSGGVSAALISNVRTLFPYKPSTLKNTEIGMRSDLANGKVRFNWTVFNTIWADLQAAGVVFDPVTGVQIPTLVTTNVGEAKAQGVEIEMTFVPTDNLLITLAGASLDTAYTKIKPGTMSGHIPFTTGLSFADAPKTSYTIGLQHTAMLKNGASFISRLDYNYQGQFWRSEPFLRVSGYAAVPKDGGYDESGNWGVVNLRFTYEPAGKNWQASFFGTNVTNEFMINSGFFHGIWGYDFATIGRPREAGVSLTYRF